VSNASWYQRPRVPSATTRKFVLARLDNSKSCIWHRFLFHARADPAARQKPFNHVLVQSGAIGRREQDERSSFRLAIAKLAGPRRAIAMANRQRCQPRCCRALAATRLAKRRFIYRRQSQSPTFDNGERAGLAIPDLCVGWWIRACQFTSGNRWRNSQQYQPPQAQTVSTTAGSNRPRFRRSHARPAPPLHINSLNKQPPPDSSRARICPALPQKLQCHAWSATQLLFFGANEAALRPLSPPRANDLAKSTSGGWRDIQFLRRTPRPA